MGDGIEQASESMKRAIQIIIATLWLAWFALAGYGLYAMNRYEATHDELGGRR